MNLWAIPWKLPYSLWRLKRKKYSIISSKALVLYSLVVSVRKLAHDTHGWTKKIFLKRTLRPIVLKECHQSERTTLFDGLDRRAKMVKKKRNKNGWAHLVRPLTSEGRPHLMILIKTSSNIWRVGLRPPPNDRRRRRRHGVGSARLAAGDDTSLVIAARPERLPDEKPSKTRWNPVKPAPTRPLSFSRLSHSGPMQLDTRNSRNTKKF